jgi:hypothetical protein
MRQTPSGHDFPLTLDVRVDYALTAAGLSRGAVALWVDESYPCIEIHRPHPTRAALAHRSWGRADDAPA